MHISTFIKCFKFFSKMRRRLIKTASKFFLELLAFCRGMYTYSPQIAVQKYAFFPLVVVKHEKSVIRNHLT